MVKAWRQVFRWAAPEAVVFEYAPTALLAARGLQMLRVMFGVGFSSPPRAHPLPSFRPWEEVPVQRLESSESLVLDCINWVLAKLDEPGLDALHELFDVDDDFLCTFPELDHYGPRAAAQYCGPIFPADNGSTPTWPNVGKKKIYVYIRPGMRSFIHLAKALNALPYSVLWIAPGVDTSLMRRFESPTLKFMREPVQLSAAFTQADAAVLYGSHGMTFRCTARGYTAGPLSESRRADAHQPQRGQTRRLRVDTQRGQGRAGACSAKDCLRRSSI